MLNTPFSPWPSFDHEDAEAVSRVLRSNRVNYWTGQECRDFEREFARWCSVPHAVALANGTVALELAFRALGVGLGDEVIVSPRTFVASASSIVAVGAEPVFADVHPDSQNLTAESVAQVLTPRTRAVLCVHLAGWPCEMEPIVRLARERDLYVVEDCAQAHGARYRERAVGSLGDVAAWSFCQDKIMTTGGEGGMLTTADPGIWQRAWEYKDHGKDYELVQQPVDRPGFRWLHRSFGTNWRMLELQAVLGRLQLNRMPVWHARRARNASFILATSAELPGLRVPAPPKHVEHAWYRAYVFIDASALASGWSRDRVVAEIQGRGVPCQTGSCSEIYLEGAFNGTPFRPSSRLPVARALGESSIAFLVHPTLTDSEIQRTTEVVREVMRAAIR